MSEAQTSKPEVRAVVFDCDGVLADNDSSWQNIHDHFGTENSEMLAKFLRKEITDEEFVADDLRMWREVQPEIHRDEIMRCYSGIKLMLGARDVVDALQARGILVAIVSSGVDLLIGSIAHMLKVDDWAANGFEWDDEGWLVGAKPTVVDSHNKGVMVTKLARINGIDPANIVSVGDSGPDISMMIPGSRFVGFNPASNRGADDFTEVGVPVVQGKDLRDIWLPIFGESFPE